MAEDKNKKELNKRGGMLSSADFRKYLVRKDVPKMKELFRDRDWKQINGALGHERGFIIDPFNPLNLMPFSYDLSIGDEAFSCRLESRGSFAIGDEKNAYKMEPGETVIVRTLEYIALHRCYSATIWPRFNFVREGIFQSMVKIDPTWYGKLGIALTNLSPTEYPIWKGREFATLVLYELTSNTDITLYRSGEILDDRKKVEVPLDGVQVEKLESEIKKKGLEGKCTIEDNKLIIRIALDKEEFEKLMQVDDSENWKKVVEKSMRMKTMAALGLPELDLILEKDPKGKRLTRGDVAKEASKCTPEALSRMAVERGRPFELIANIPKLTEEFARGQVEIEFNKEIKEIILRIMAITISLLGFISLIVAIIALIARQLKWTLPLDVDWNDTLFLAMVVIGVVLVPVLLYIFSLWRTPKGITKVRKQLKEINIELTKRVKDIDDRVQEKTIELREEIESIKSRMK